MPRKLERCRLESRSGGHLFPECRSYKGVLKLQIAGGGLKDKIYVYLCTAIAYCLEHDLFLDWDGDLEGYGKWTEWFEPFACDRSKVMDGPEIFHKPSWGEMSPLFCHMLDRYPPTFVRNIWRHSSEAARRIDHYAAKIRPPAPYVAAQIRRGDKLRWNMVLPAGPAQIRPHLPRDCRRIYLATDDYTVIEEFRAFSDIEVYSSCRPEHRGSDTAQGHFLVGTKESRHAESLRLFADIAICRDSALFLRARSPRKLAHRGHGRLTQIGDLISDLRERENEIKIP